MCSQTMIRSANNNFVKFVLLLVAICAELAVSQVRLDPNNPTVDTSLGRVKGTPRDIGSGRSVASFIGIPYAASPTGGNRFREPQPAVRWQGELDATTNPSNRGRVLCPQVQQRFRYNDKSGIRESENCLYLNVFAPIQQITTRGRLPVIVYLHGGEFKYGGKDLYKPDILLQKEVILVVPNYRLGVLGFFATDDDNSPGNFGLRDQVQVLRWVRNEILAFGGDGDQITIFGHDAGAVSVSMLLFAPEARGLFNRSISVGGTIFTPWALQEEPYWTAREYSRRFNCPSDTRKMVRCLRDKTADELMSAARVNGYYFRPVIDRNTSNPMLKDTPTRLYERNEFAKVPYLCGLMAKEGSLDYYLRFDRINRDASTRDTLEALLTPYLRRYTNAKVVASAVDYHYFQRYNTSLGGIQRLPISPGGGGGSVVYPNNNQLNPSLRQQPFPINMDAQYVEIMGDFLYNAPTDTALKYHSRSGQNTYLYVLDYQGTKSFGPLQIEAPAGITRDSYGTTHFDDTFYILPNEYNNQELDQAGKQVGDLLSRCIVQFVSPGTVPFGNCNWQPYTSMTQNYLKFSNGYTPQASVMFKKSSDMSFWSDLVRNLVELTATPLPYFPYSEYNSYQAATWSMLAVILILLLIAAALAAVIITGKRNDKRSMKLLRARDRELEDRGETEKL